MRHPGKVLQVEDLHKFYGKVEAVAGVSFSVGVGEIVGLLGPNGAGKTTLINMVLGVLDPTSGRVAINGRLVSTMDRDALQDANFAAVYAPLPGNLTVEENLSVFGLLYGIHSLGERIAELLQRFDLEKFRDTRTGLLSSGEQTRVCLAKAMLNRPKLLLLDEPTASLDPSAARHNRSLIRDLVKEGKCGVLWTSHNMREVEAVCDRVIFLSHGKVMLEGDPNRLPGESGKSNLEELFIALANEPLTPPLE